MGGGAVALQHTLNPLAFRCLGYGILSLKPHSDSVSIPTEAQRPTSTGMFGVLSLLYSKDLKDEMTLKSRGPVPLYYESLYGI